MIVVVNSTPLIYLAAIGKFDLLRSLFGQIVIPMAVYDEVVIVGEESIAWNQKRSSRWARRDMEPSRIFPVPAGDRGTAA